MIRGLGHFIIDTIVDTTSLTEVFSAALNPGEWFFDVESSSTED